MTKVTLFKILKLGHVFGYLCMHGNVQKSNLKRDQKKKPSMPEQKENGLTQESKQSTVRVVSFESIVKTPYDVVSSRRLSTAENQSNSGRGSNRRKSIFPISYAQNSIPGKCMRDQKTEKSGSRHKF